MSILKFKIYELLFKKLEFVVVCAIMSLRFLNFERYNMATIGERIKKLRKSAGLTQSEFGNIFGIVKSTVSSYEHDNSVPDDQTKIAICKRFNVSVDYLLGVSADSAVGKEDQKEKSPSISDEDIKFALFGGEGEITDEMWQAVKEYAQFIKDKHGKK